MHPAIPPCMSGTAGERAVRAHRPVPARPGHCLAADALKVSMTSRFVPRVIS